MKTFSTNKLMSNSELYTINKLNQIVSLIDSDTSELLRIIKPSKDYNNIYNLLSDLKPLLSSNDQIKAFELLADSLVEENDYKISTEQVDYNLLKLIVKEGILNTIKDFIKKNLLKFEFRIVTFYPTFIIKPSKDSSKIKSELKTLLLSKDYQVLWNLYDNVDGEITLMLGNKYVWS